jgi:hypothetical protein
MQQLSRNTKVEICDRAKCFNDNHIADRMGTIRAAMFTYGQSL